MYKIFMKSGRTLFRSSMIAVALVASNHVLAQSDIATITRNIQPIGQVCIVGQNCSSRGATNTAAGAAVSTPAPAATSPEPTAQATTTTAAATFDPAAVYQQSCFACHGSGAAGAPKLGDAEAWEARMTKGIDTVLANSINGLGAMPAKGMCMTCTEDNMRTLIDYMVSGGQ